MLSFSTSRNLGAILFMLTIMFSFAVTALAEQVSPISPDEIVSLVNREKLEGLKNVWEKLRIESELFQNLQPDKVRADVRELDGREGSEAIIEVTDFGKTEGQYLVFSRRGGQWVFLGNLDFNNLYFPDYRLMEKGNGGGWLVISSHDFHGTGASLTGEHWWDLSGERLKEVLSYPVKGYVQGWGMSFDREVSSQVLGYDKNPFDKFKVYMSFSAIYYDGVERMFKYKENILFAVVKRVLYVWDSSQGRFVVDSQFSDMAEEEINGLFNDDNDRFLKHNFEDIKKIAISKDENNREWLKGFFKDCSDSPEKTALLELLR